MDIKTAIGMLISGEGLLNDEAYAVMGDIMRGEATPAQIGAYLTALRMKGETVEEVAGSVRAMREHATHIQTRHPDIVDTCGTGGDGKHTFNVSTTAAFIAAGAGVPIAKHGNRAASSQCGSADVLEALGVNVGASPAIVKKCVDEIGIGFLFAQKHHPAMKHAIGPRKEMGVRTIFNFLGPLTNPADAKRQLIGVADANWGERLARVLETLGSESVLVVAAEDGLDEISNCAPTRIWELKEGEVQEHRLDPQDFGFPRATLEDLKGGTADDGAETITAILEGRSGPRRDISVLNAAAAILVGGRADTWEEALDAAKTSIDSGSALRKLEGLVSHSNETVI